MGNARSAARTCRLEASASEYTATASRPSAWQARMIRSAISPRFAISTRVMLMRGRRPCARPVEANAGGRDSAEQAPEQPNRHAEPGQRDRKEGETDREGSPLAKEHRPGPRRVLAPQPVDGELGERPEAVAEIGEDAVHDGATEQQAKRRGAYAQRRRQRLGQRGHRDRGAARGADDQVVAAPALLPPLEDGGRGPPGRGQRVEELDQVGQRGLRRWSRPIWRAERGLSSTLLCKAPFPGPMLRQGLASLRLCVLAPSERNIPVLPRRIAVALGA